MDISTTIGQRIKSLREQRDLTQEQLAKVLGVTDGSVSNWENGTKTPRMGMFQSIADYFGVKVSYLLGNEEWFDVFSIPGIEPPPKTVKKPLLGTIACGEPILAAENIDDYIDVPQNIHCDFALNCKGDSMIGARIHDGDIVYIRKQPDVENGQIAAILIDDEATLKRVYKHNGQIVLQAENPAFPPMIISGITLNGVRIIGLAVGFTSVVR